MSPIKTPWGTEFATAREHGLRIYLAGPLFTAYELWWNAKVASALRSFGVAVWLPQEEEYLQRYGTDEAIFAHDVSGIDWARCVVANVDGTDPDSGTAWELGYAYGRGYPTFYYRTDTRANPVNLMLTRSAREIVLHLPPLFDNDFSGPMLVAARIKATLETLLENQR